MKKIITLLPVYFLILFILCSCSSHITQFDISWKNDTNYDISLPDENDENWYLVFKDDFNGSKLNSDIEWGSEDLKGIYSDGIWTFSPHGFRRDGDNGKALYTNYWCDDLVEIRDGYVHIYGKEETNHVCSSGICPAQGRFSGGIETRRVMKANDQDNDVTKGDGDDVLFGQAFGYYETRVKFPNAEGLWAAFWLQSSNQRLISAEGVDGTEIDIFESAFIKNKTLMGNALLWNGYGSYAKSEGSLFDTKTDLYDGFHTFALKWTPNYYVFYVDGVAYWASMGGGVSRVKEFLRLTVEMDGGDGYGPHGEKIGKFIDNTSEFIVDYVKVLQNKTYEKYEIDNSYFLGELDKVN